MSFAEHFAGMWWAYVVIFVMICLSAYFSASEIAFNSANKMRLRKAHESGSYTAGVAYRICEKFTTSLSAILIGNNLAILYLGTKIIVGLSKFLFCLRFNLCKYFLCIVLDPSLMRIVLLEFFL